MIEVRTSGDIFTCGADAMVNPVNCVGTSGAGLAKEFRWRFPEAQEVYVGACHNRALRPGNILVNAVPRRDPNVIVFFPTKQHWRNTSVLADVDAGLLALRWWLEDEPVKTIAIPALGCGLGGLAFEDVLPLMERHLGALKVRAWVYGPRVTRAER